jgi:hypothetical protein
VHDTYVHDTDSEGYYFGWTGDPPSYLFPNLQIYNNRIVRTGSERCRFKIWATARASTTTCSPSGRCIGWTTSAHTKMAACKS